MEKILVFSGILILLAVLIVNRVFFEISDIMNIVLCALAACMMVGGIILKDLKV